VKRDFKQPDSLELLLDTMCNTFGGIILIALLVALLARDVDSPPGKNATGAAPIASADRQQDLQTARKYIQALRKQLDTALLSEQTSLARALDQARQKLASIQHEKLQQEIQARAAASPDAAATLARDLDAQSERLQNELSSASNKLTSAAQTLTNAKVQLTALQQQLASAQQERTRSLRMPREHSVTKDQFYFILKYNQIYPVHLPGDAQFIRNTTGIDWTSKGPDSEAVLPIRGKGLDLVQDKGFIESILNRLDRDRYYIGFQVFNDSFSPFDGLKQIVVANGFDYGINPLLPDDVIETGGTSKLPAQ
jgi:hypothetical protein